MFSREIGVNKWKILCITCWKTDNLSVCIQYCNLNDDVVYLYISQVKEHFERSGYTAHGEPVDVQVASDEKTITVTMQSVNITTGWRVEQLQVYSA